MTPRNAQITTRIARSHQPSWTRSHQPVLDTYPAERRLGRDACPAERHLGRDACPAERRPGRWIAVVPTWWRHRLALT
jgi:hypothetical protein